MNFKKQLLVFIVSVALVSCAPEPIVTPTETFTPALTSTPKPIATLTPTPIPLVNFDGLLFFDYNGNGISDNGEPPIASFTVCVKSTDICVETNQDGRFYFAKVPSADSQMSLSFIDPNSDNPSLAFRYINIWVSETIIPAYEKDGIKVVQQNLNKTTITLLSEGIHIQAGESVTIGLMQGFLTMPLAHDSWYFTYNWVDLNPELGSVRNYHGVTRVAISRQDVVNQPLAVSDGHDAIDYAIKNSTIVYAALPGDVIDTSFFGAGKGGRVLIQTRIGNAEYIINYGHPSVFLVNKGDKVQRGQAIAAAGEIQELHFQLLTLPQQREPCKYFGFPSRSDDYHPEETPRLDPFRDELNLSCTCIA